MKDYLKQINKLDSKEDAFIVGFNMGNTTTKKQLILQIKKDLKEINLEIFK